MVDHGNGTVSGRLMDLGVMKKRKKQSHVEVEAGSNFYGRRDADSNDGYDDDDYDTHISEERYRSMLGEHIQKYRRVQFKESASRPSPSQMGMSGVKRSVGSKGRKLGNEERMLQGVEITPTYVRDSDNYYESDLTPEYGGDMISSIDYALLDIGEGITYRFPPTYDKLAASLKLPSFKDIQVDEYYLKSTLDMESMAMMMTSYSRFGYRNRSGMGEPQPQYESLQARLKALSACNSVQKFNLQVCDISLDSNAIPEGAAGGIRRSIMSEGGMLHICYVKVLEKGDTYEIIERSLPKKELVTKDSVSMEREEMDKIGKLWVNIAKRDIPRYQRSFTNFHKKQLIDAKRFSETCQREVKLKVSRSIKLMRGAAIRTRKLTRDMLVFWKRIDKEQAEVRKREEKEAAEALKREEEQREAKRQQQRLNFLLSQTELFSHFMQNKPTSQSSEALPVGAEGSTDQATDDPSVAIAEEEEDPEEAEMKREALRAAQAAVSQQQKITSAFDNECMKLRQVLEPEEPPNDASIAGSSNIDLLNPSTMPIVSSVQTPEMFKGSLKEYQLKGLQWLVNCYEQGLNGILADEMGLGKTIQAMAFLAHLAEEKNIWGPFLVVAPASVLNNWADEISRFCPDLKTLPYWGGLKEREILRKNINPKRLYRREAGFHILITSYQLLVADEKWFRRVKWQYMVLDEAQAIKSSTSQRWKTLLSFNCRNRLLLTGTPIQNNMAELWALLHFIMPTLFDSHDQFNEWFSKGIESHAEHGGTLNEHQLNRLHAVLKPFMLRRVKKDVITEMTAKVEVTVHCKLSSRQQAFYQAIKNKISLSELFDSRRGHLNDKKILNLMNIVIQLRKVCNHPELFERNEGSTYMYFGDIPNTLLPPSFGDMEDIYYAGSQNPISYKVPKLVYEEICQSDETQRTQIGCHEKLFNIFSPANIHQSSIAQDRKANEGVATNGGSFGFTRLIDLSAEEIAFLARGSFLERMLFSIMRWEQQFLDEHLDLLMEDGNDGFHPENLEREKVRAVTRMLLIPSRSESKLLRKTLISDAGHVPYDALVVSHEDRLISNTKLLHAIYAFIPPTRSPPINAHCSARSFAYKTVEELHNPWVKRLFIGFARTSECNGPREPSGPTHHLIQEIDSELPVSQPVLQNTYKIFGSSPPMQSFDPAKMLTDSGKLQTLDILLKRLRAGNHRVLLFAQMTKMLNILEDYMNYRKYRYLRLDGSSTIMDRRDMVRDFQHRNDIFVFLLSTRAGGLGINLTAADTVIFYESDWNPTLDLQAMDRAHRLGQTKEVTVYRLICKETVEEKILQRASQKNTVQQLVMTGGHVQDDLLAPEDVVSLLLDDPQMEQKFRQLPLQTKDRQKNKKRGTKGIRIDADGGDASLEDLTDKVVAPTPVPEDTPERGTNNKKRKTNGDNTKARNNNPTDHEVAADIEQKPKRPKRPKKSVSVNENLEPAFTAASTPSTQIPEVSGYVISTLPISEKPNGR
ncbi:DNA helicase [Ranunculus cassubicifolius]